MGRMGTSNDPTTDPTTLSGLDFSVQASPDSG